MADPLLLKPKPAAAAAPAAGAELALVGEGGVWLEAYDQTRGKKYYYNSVTKETKWKLPK